MGFSKGDTVVHPRHGVGEVQGTPTRGTGVRKTEYVELFFAPKDLTIMVPLESADEIGIRPVTSEDAAHVILAILEEPSDVPTAWTERNATTLSRIKSTELAQASMVIRDLTRHAARSGKPLSAAENGALTACMDTVARELSLSLGLSEDETRDLILEKVGSASASADADA